MDLKEEIKNSIKLSFVIGKNLSLKRRDKSNFVALCPFHKEKTPSFNISDEKGFYHCFGCGKNGDIFDYVMEMENKTFTEALKKLADEAGLRHASYNFVENPKIKKNINLLKRVSDSYIQNLNAPIGENARNYLYLRGVNEEIIRDFMIGYSGNLKSNQYLISCLIKEGFSLDEIIEIGLAKRNYKKELVFYFQQRIMIPILDNRGKVIAFGGRVLSDGNPKYINSPETHLFQKGRQLFGLTNAKKLLNKKRLIVCEGYMDVISLNKHGYPAVASLGTALTESQMDKIFNIADEAFLVFDGDVAGQNATLRVFEKYLPKLKFGKKLKFIFLPNSLDPEDFINQNGVNEFEVLLDKALSCLDMIWSQGLKMVKENEPETKALFWSYLRNMVNKIEDLNIKVAYKDEIEKRIKIFRNMSRGQSQSISGLKRKDYQYSIQNKFLPKTGVEIKNGAIIYMMLMSPKLCLNYDEKITLLNFGNKELNKLKELILLQVNKQSSISSEILLDGIIRAGFSNQIKKIMESNYSSRLNLKQTSTDSESWCKVFEELLSLANIKKI